MTSTGELIEGRPAREVLAWSRAVVEPALRATADGLPESMRHIAGYHFGWWDEKGSPSATSGGKAIRPALAVLSAQAVGGTAQDALPAAVAVQLVHDFSLLHDDVMDGDVSRRHRPTAWTVFGRGPAILAGDALVTVAFDVLAASGHPAAASGMRMLSKTVLGLVEGQSADVSFEERTDVGLPECVRMVEGKTGTLLGCSCALGAAYGGGTPEQVEALGDFGRNVGLAFQLVDDLLGIWGDPDITGKPVYSDLRNRKKSLPVVAALDSPTPEAEELAALYYRAEPLTDSELVHAARLVDGAGGRSWSQQRADELLDQSLLRLEAELPASQAVAELSALARLAVRRDH
ncbi:family 2 encapsulin nanocompartment cargo protein polyprenyl transferase [Nocardiopsis ansamitocini]|uniref:Dimethylallyltransferase n=1 Tax=Nocardiopsis ansamitocini TaxID=1670832 RepID=A0A9W6P9H6_9ACTN|nr:family 2 encapsulin nanocompartment cargo protein polyprenyl transferase [Nocardiopsis ansamitocini]GLU49509.1 dimethylallyltransferase [Nocardiopsis ansamitocini]